MKILFVAPYIPSRIRVRTFHILSELAKRHEVHLVALVESKTAAQCGYEEVSGLCKSVTTIPHPKLKGARQAAAALLSPSPMCTAYCRSSKLKKAVWEVLSSVKIDVIHVEHLRAAHFVPRRCKTPVVFDSVDCLTDLFGQMASSGGNVLRRLVMAEETWKLRRYEPKMMKQLGKVVVTSEAERSKLLLLDGTLDVTVVPNGVDTDYFAPSASPKRPDRIVFSGKMGYMPNSQAVLWFAENVMPEVRKSHPEAEFLVVGQDPPAKVAKIGESDGITVTGFVDDIRPHIDRSAIAVAPMQIAVGVQNKALEALAMGVPVVATGVVARAIGKDCPGIIAAETAQDMIRHINYLIENPETARELGDKGRRLLNDRFGWAASITVLERVYREVTI